MKTLKRALAFLLAAVLTLGSCAVVYASSEIPFYSNSRFYEISMDQADAKFDNGDTFVYILYRPNCNNCNLLGKRIFSCWMNDYNANIYGTDVSDLNSLPWFLYDEFINKRIVTPLVVFVKNKTYKTVMAYYEGVGNDLNRAFCELRGTTYVPVTSATFPSKNVKINRGDTQQLTLNIQPSNASIKGVYWRSGDPDIVSVSQDGVITGLKSGSTVIYADLSDSDLATHTEALNPYCWVTVNVPVTGISLPQSHVTLEVGEEMAASPIFSPADTTYTAYYYGSSNKNVLDIVGGGVLRAVAPGTATLTVSTYDRKYSATCTVTVVAAKVEVTGVAVSKSSLSIENGTSAQLSASVYPSNASNKNVSWRSSNSSVVSVDSNGKITAKSVGTATITVKTADGGYESSCTVTVVAAMPKISIRNNTQIRAINHGDILRLQAEIKDAPAGSRVLWQINNDHSGVNCFLDNNDKSICYVQATGSGSCTLYAVLADANGEPVLDANGNKIFDSQTIKVNSGLIQIIVSFFKNLFGFNRVIMQSIRNGIPLN